MGASFTDCMLYLLAALAVWILLRCARSLLGRRTVPEPLAALELSGKDALGHGIGRSERSSLAVMDDGFAKAILKALEAYSTRR